MNEDQLERLAEAAFVLKGVRNSINAMVQDMIDDGVPDAEWEEVDQISARLNDIENGWNAKAKGGSS